MGTMRLGYLGLGIGSLIVSALSTAVVPIVETRVADFSHSKTYRTGVKYPHSGKRQNARYARQLAAKQINFITHGPRAA
jgi:hypothetical protein